MGIVFDDALKKCPKDEAMISLPPWAKDLEALICKEAKKGDNEQTAIKAACGEIAKKLPAVPENTCEKVGGIVFDDALKKCPKGEAMIRPLDSKTGPQDIIVV